MRELFDLIRRKNTPVATGKLPPPPTAKDKLAKQRSEIVSELALMKARLMALGLFATAQRLDPALRMSGFELAGDIEACLRYENDLERRLP